MVVVLCVSVCYQDSCYIPSLRAKNEVSQGSLLHSKCMYCVDFADADADADADVHLIC